MPVESRSGARETIISGPYHNLILVRQDRDAQRVEREDTWEGCPLIIRLGLRKRRKLPRPKIDLCIFRVRKKPPGTPFSVFLAMAGPKRCGAQENSPPSRRAWLQLQTILPHPGCTVTI